MLWMFATAGLTGILCGCLFRAPALVFLSFVTFGGAFVLSVIVDWSVWCAFVTAVLLTAALQVGYLLGAGLCYVLYQFRSRLGGGVEISPDFQNSLR
jgi:hypothetical protein